MTDMMITISMQIFEDMADRIEELEAKLAQQSEMTDEKIGNKLSMIVITDTVEHEDGSATYTFDMDDASSKKITELGIELILTCAAYGLDIQDALTLISNYGKEKNND
jgi:hypothetical protein